MRRLVIIGGGIAGQALVTELCESKAVDSFDDVLQLAAPLLAPPATLSSTALAALRGTRPGLSSLGDELCAGWQLARTRYARCSSAAVLPLPLTNLCFEERTAARFAHLPEARSPVDLRRAARRAVAEEAFLIRPEVFLAEERAKSAARVRYHETFVRALRPTTTGMVVRTSEDEIEAAVVVLAAGAWGSWFAELARGTPLETLRSVQGSYFQWENVDLATSFALSVDGVNLFADAPARRLILGATTVKDCQHFRPDHAALSSLWRTLEEKIVFALPPVRDAEIRTGIRSVLKSRAPWSGQIGPHLFASSGLYKNGWLSAWREAQKLVALL